MKAAGLPGSLVGGRQLAVLVSLADAAQAGRLAATLLAQRLRPAEVIASCPAAVTDAVRSALGALGGSGIRVVVAPGAAPTAAALTGEALTAAGVDWARPLARLARAPWLAPWAADGGQPEHYLLDLACARECAQADAVAASGPAWEYEFTRRLEEPALVRAHLLDPAGPRRVTGAATGCGCSPSRTSGRGRFHHEISGQGATGIGRIKTKRAGLR